MSLPEDTQRLTAEPGVTKAPVFGSCLTTAPATSWQLLSCVTDPRTNPAPVIAVVATAWSRCSTLGITTAVGHQTTAAGAAYGRGLSALQSDHHWLVQDL